MLTKEEKYGVMLCHNGTIVKYTVDDGADILKADRLLDYIQEAFSKKRDISVDLALLESIGVKMEVFYS
jgi:hypothetical protein